MLVVPWYFVVVGYPGDLPRNATHRSPPRLSDDAVVAGGSGYGGDGS